MAIACAVVAFVLNLPLHVMAPHRLAEDGGLALLAFSAGGRIAYRIMHDTDAFVPPFAPLVAIVGSDGSGKSTLAADMLLQLNRDHHAEVCYLGLGSGDIGNWIKGLPIIGPSLERALASKAQQTRTKGEHIPGVVTASVVFALSLMRRRRFRRMLALRHAGVIVVTDRYPQVEVPGFFDGPGLSAARASGRVVGWLAARERRMYEWMASYQPDVVIRLNVDAATAFSRKPDHNLALLRAKVAATPLLRFNGAKIVDLDSRRPYAEVRARAIAVALQAIDHPRPLLKSAA